MMDDQHSEDIKQQMAKTRSKLADKLEILEEQIIEPAAVAVTETVTTVKEAVGDTAEAVQSTVKTVMQAFDLAAQVRKHPWEMVGASVATGFVLGQFMNPPTSTVRLQFNDAVPITPEPSFASVRGVDPQQNRSNGTYAPRQAIAGSSTDSHTDQRRGDGWAKFATEVQSTLIHALAPVCQALIGAALAELLRPSRANPPPREASDSNLVRENAQYGQQKLDEWSTLDDKPEPEWSGRLRSTPR